MRYIALGVVWLVLIVVSMLVIMWRTQYLPGLMVAGPLVAARHLSANHLLQPDDLKVDESPHGYLTKEVPKGQPVPPTDIAAQPMLTARVFMLTMPVNVSLLRDGTVDTNTQLRVCKHKEELAKDLRVLAVLCPSEQHDACIALLAIPKDKLNLVSDQPLGPDVEITTGNTCG